MPDNDQEVNVNTRKLPTAIPMILNAVTVIAFLMALVDRIQGFAQHADANFNYPLMNAMSIVWLLFGVLALSNSIAIQKIIEYIQPKHDGAP